MNQGMCCKNKRSRWTKFWNNLWNKLFGEIPNWHEFVVLKKIKNLKGETENLYVAEFLNDSYEIGIGFPDKWLVILRREYFHKLILWYIWRWIWGEWFGLRRWLFYKFLSLRVKKYSKFGKL